MKAHPLKTTGNAEYVVAGSFAPAGTGAPTDVYGTGFTVVRTSAGLFTVTLTNPAIRIRGGTVSLQKAAAADTHAEFGTTAVSAATPTFQIRVFDSATATETDIAADANNRVHFLLHLSEDTVQA
jgi:hypothetical protein